MAQAQTETLAFQAETRQLLDLMIHSLYSHREIFLRELISNASDALDKLRFESIAKPELRPEDTELKIRIEVDKEARTLSLHDNGIGMNKKELVANIGTIAKSGTRELYEKLQKNKNTGKATDVPEDMIGQFGVGFYSSFMVADKVTVVTRRAGQKSALQWESDGKGEYTIGKAKRDEQGTSITLHLLDADADKDIEDYTEGHIVRRVIKKYSDFVRYPIEFEEKTVNSMKAIWRKRQSEVTEEEYTEFYKHISHDWEAPQKTITLKAEGMLEYDALLYIPGRQPFDLYKQGDDWGPTLYAKNVRILEHCPDLVPRYLRFVTGVVDSSDLPLNVSRELLQNHGQIRVVKKGITKKILDTLKSMHEKDREEYLKFWNNFGSVLKEGVTSFEADNKDKIAPLLFFYSSHEPGTLTTLKEYIGRMPDDQDAIYYLTGESIDMVANSPHLEAFQKKGIEVLYLVDGVDEFVVQTLTEFEEKPIKSAAKGDFAVGDEDERKRTEKDLEEKSKAFSGVLEKVQKHLDGKIREARLSARLTDSPVCLVGGDSDMSPQLARMYAQSKNSMPSPPRIMELNPNHPIVQQMNAAFGSDENDPDVDNYADLLFGLGLVAEGTMPQNPATFTRLVADMMAKDTTAAEAQG